MRILSPAVAQAVDRDVVLHVEIEGLQSSDLLVDDHLSTVHIFLNGAALPPSSFTCTVDGAPNDGTASGLGAAEPAGRRGSTPWAESRCVPLPG